MTGGFHVGRTRKSPYFWGDVIAASVQGFSGRGLNFSRPPSTNHVRVLKIISFCPRREEDGAMKVDPEQSVGDPAARWLCFRRESHFYGRAFFANFARFVSDNSMKVK